MIILDTHTLIWFIMNDVKLSNNAKKLVVSSEAVFVSVATLWEIAIKMSIGKLSLDGDFDDLFPAQLLANELKVLPIHVDHLSQVSQLPLHHRDPFDRLIIAQGMVENMPIISRDAAFDAYPVKRIW
ncbi:MAG TPA: type II toxin-antitoxin system VapC family toxin [Anaerolineae bacterium]|nr:type II toxin-antitoxin system VapC family toxin [Anaerolineae bacterium]